MKLFFIVSLIVFELVSLIILWIFFRKRNTKHKKYKYVFKDSFVRTDADIYNIANVRNCIEKERPINERIIKNVLYSDIIKEGMSLCSSDINCRIAIDNLTFEKYVSDVSNRISIPDYSDL